MKGDDRLYAIFSPSDAARTGFAIWELFDGGEAQVSLVGTMDELKECADIWKDAEFVGEVTDFVRSIQPPILN